jgi:putative acetyltransferase
MNQQPRSPIVLTVRPERPDDADPVRTVLTTAFPTDADARLVDALRSAGRPTDSLVAVDGGRVVGHIAFSPVTVNGIGGVGLAPVAVLAEYQRRGVGSQLVREGLRRAKESGAAFAVVLGEPWYYSRFGFGPASRWGLSDEYGGSEAFQAVVWVGTPPPERVKYAPEFGMFG